MRLENALIYLFLLMVGCNTNDESSIKVSFSNKKQIEINPKIEGMSFYHLGSGFRDSTVQYRRLNKLVAHSSGHLYILDRETGDYDDVSIKKFGPDGQFVSRLNMSIGGDQPFRFVKDFEIFNSRLYALDYGKSGIWSVHLDSIGFGNWSLRSTPEPFDKFFPYDDNQFVFDSNNSQSQFLDNSTYGVFQMTEEKNWKLSFRSREISPELFEIGISGSRFAYDCSNSKLYFSAYMKTEVDVFDFDNQDIAQTYKFTLGEKSYQGGLSQEDFTREKARQDLVVNFDKVIVHQGYMLGTFRYQRKVYWLICDLKNKEAELILPNIPYVHIGLMSYVPLDIDCKGFIYFSLDQNELYSFLTGLSDSERQYWLELIENHDQLSSDEGLMIMKIPMSYFIKTIL